MVSESSVIDSTLLYVNVSLKYLKIGDKCKKEEVDEGLSRGRNVGCLELITGEGYPACSWESSHAHLLKMELTLKQQHTNTLTQRLERNTLANEF